MAACPPAECNVGRPCVAQRHIEAATLHRQVIAWMPDTGGGPPGYTRQVRTRWRNALYSHSHSVRMRPARAGARGAQRAAGRRLPAGRGVPELLRAVHARLPRRAAAGRLAARRAGAAPARHGALPARAPAPAGLSERSFLHWAHRLVTGHIVLGKFIRCPVTDCSSCAGAPQLGGAARARRRSEHAARRPAQAGSLPHERGRDGAVGGRGPAGGRAVRPERHPHRARQPLPAVHRSADAGAVPAPHPGLHRLIRQQAGPERLLSIRVSSKQLRRPEPSRASA